MSNDIAANTRIMLGMTGSRTDDNMGGLLGNQFIYSNLIVAEDDRRTSRKVQVLVDVPGEGVVVIDEDDLGGSWDLRQGLCLVRRVINNI